MPTPVDLNIVMPYGVTVRSKGTAIRLRGHHLVATAGGGCAK